MAEVEPDLVPLRDLLVQYLQPQQPLDGELFEAWSELVDAEAAVVGLIETRLGGGPIDFAELRRVKDVVVTSEVHYPEWSKIVLKAIQGVLRS